jgi:hypothetical protein
VDEVTTHAEEELALAKLIRCGANRDIVQAKKTLIKDFQLFGNLSSPSPSFSRLLKMMGVVGAPSSR